MKTSRPLRFSQSITHTPLTLLALPLCAVLFSTSALPARAKDPVPAKITPPATPTTEDASLSAYASGWKESTTATGFGGWKFQENHGADNGFAGHFIADDKANPEISPIAAGGKAFGLYANGPGYETATAFCAFANALNANTAFSFQMLNPVIAQKGATDSPAPGSVGLSLRNGDAADSTEDYNKGARFELINLKGEANYQVYDGESTHDTGVAYSEGGIGVTVTLTSADTYDLEITRMSDKKTTKLSNRKLGGSGAIESFCVFDRNGEKADAFFNRFQLRPGGK